MAEKSIKTRVQMKRGTDAEWAKATGFKPLEGEIIFYSDLNKIRVGIYKEGTTEEQKKSASHTDYLVPLSELPFLDARDADTLDGKHASEFALKANVPTVNNATLTIQKNGTTVKTFTANSATDVTANITVPTKTSELTNDSGFKTIDTTYNLAAPASKLNGDVTIDLIADGSGSATGSVQIKGSGETTVTTNANGIITISSPTTLKNPNALSIGGKSYDGSSEVSVTAAELRTHLGLNNALHFIGLTTTTIADNSTTTTITVDGKSYTAVAGDVVLYNDNEYVFDGSKWLELGDGSSYALKTNTITAGNGLTEGGQIGNNPTLNVGAGNGITVTTNAVAAKAGNGITVDSNGINHADTSSQASVTASGRKYITGVTLDTYGHVTGLTTGTETVTDTNTWRKVQLDGVDKLGNEITTKPLNIKAGTNVTITENAGTFTFSTTDNDTKVTSVDNHYTPAADSTKELSVDANSTTSATWGSTDLVTGVNIQRDAKGHVTGITVDSVQMPANPDTGATSIEVTGTGNAVTAASYNATTRKVTLTKGATYVNANELAAAVTTQINTLISSGTADPSSSTASQYYFKY